MSKELSKGIVGVVRIVVLGVGHGVVVIVVVGSQWGRQLELWAIQESITLKDVLAEDWWGQSLSEQTSEQMCCEESIGVVGDITQTLPITHRPDGVLEVGVVRAVEPLPNRIAKQLVMAAADGVGVDVLGVNKELLREESSDELLVPREACTVEHVEGVEHKFNKRAVLLLGLALLHKGTLCGVIEHITPQECRKLLHITLCVSKCGDGVRSGRSGGGGVGCMLQGLGVEVELSKAAQSEAPTV